MPWPGGNGEWIRAALWTALAALFALGLMWWKKISPQGLMEEHTVWHTIGDYLQVVEVCLGWAPGPVPQESLFKRTGVPPAGSEQQTLDAEGISGLQQGVAAQQPPATNMQLFQYDFAADPGTPAWPEQQPQLNLPAVTSVQVSQCGPRAGLEHALALVRTTQLWFVHVSASLPVALAALMACLPQLPALRVVTLHDINITQPLYRNLVQHLFDMHHRLQQVVVQHLGYSASFSRQVPPAGQDNNPTAWLFPARTSAALLAYMPLAVVRECVLQGSLIIADAAQLMQATRELMGDRRPRPRFVCVGLPAAHAESMAQVPGGFAPILGNFFCLYWRGGNDPELPQPLHLPLLVQACSRGLRCSLVLRGMVITRDMMASISAAPTTVRALGLESCTFRHLSIRGAFKLLPGHILHVGVWGGEEGEQVWARAWWAPGGWRQV